MTQDIRTPANRNVSPTPLNASSPIVSPAALLWRHRSMLWQTTRNEIRTRFAGSLLGLAWLVLYPLLFLGTYALVYGLIFKVRVAAVGSTADYVALIFCGLIPFLGFSEALASGVGCVVQNVNLIKNTLFPVELIPVKAVLVSQSTQVVGLAILIAAVAALGRLTPWVLLLPLIWVLQLLLTTGLLWILSSLNVYLRDLQNVISVVILMLMLISPIAYTEDMVPAGLRWTLVFNPLYYLIVSYQNTLMLGACPPVKILVALAVLAVSFFAVGFWFFGRMKRVFADNV